jgi:hypothetical protein
MIIINQYLIFEKGIEIDMWSFACILPELRTALPIFPGFLKIVINKLKD